MITENNVIYNRVKTTEQGSNYVSNRCGKIRKTIW
jgi:hypothetical protein